MSSTNKTTYYELSQYIGTDKPTYLGDYNSDMSKIDAGITGQTIKPPQLHKMQEAPSLELAKLKKLCNHIQALLQRCRQMLLV